VRAVVVAAAVAALPIPHSSLVKNEAVAQQLKGTLAISIGLFLIGVEFGRGFLDESRKRLALLYRTMLFHQASARAGSLTGLGERGSPVAGAEVAVAEADAEANRITWIGAVVNVLLAGFKLLAGLLCGSAALVADAGHSLSDLISDLVTLATLRVSRLPPDADHPYGHGRFEALGALMIGFLLVATAWGFGQHAYADLAHQIATYHFMSEPVQAASSVGSAAHGHAHGSGSGLLGELAAGLKQSWFSSTSSGAPSWLRSEHGAALLAAVASIGIKEWLYQITAAVGKKQNSQVLVANAWHHRSDALSSVVALVGIAGACLGFPMLDPLAGLGVAAMVATTGVHVGWDSIQQLTDGVDEKAVVRSAALALEVGLVPFL